MPATRAQLRRAKIIGHTVDFGDGDEVTFWYDANKITDSWLRAWRDREQEQDAPALNDMLADLIDRWDILETEDGPTVPVSAEAIGEIFALPAKIEISKELMTAGLPSDAEGNASRNISSTQTSSSTPEPVSHQNGQEPSPSPQPSASQSPT